MRGSFRVQDQVAHLLGKRRTARFTGEDAIDVPGANPSQLVLALGKDRNAYLLDRNNLGGVGAPVAQMNVSSSTLRGTSSVAYRTGEGTHFAFHTEGGELRSYIINATTPPTIALAWNVNDGGRSSPWATSTDGTNNVIVWVAGIEDDGRLLFAVVYHTEC